MQNDTAMPSFRPHFAQFMTPFCTEIAPEKLFLVHPGRYQIGSGLPKAYSAGSLEIRDPAAALTEKLLGPCSLKHKLGVRYRVGYPGKLSDTV